MKRLVKLLLAVAFCCCLQGTAWADQQTTILTDNITVGEATAALPYIDGNLATDLEKLANETIAAQAKDMLESFGKNGELDYTVTLNRPSMVSLVLRASYDGQTLYKAVNIDLTTGREFTLNDFFVDDERMQETFGKNPDIVFGNKGIYRRSAENSDYDELVPYDNILPSIRIGEAGRLFQIARLTKNAHGKVLHIPAGSLMALKLDANPSTGYTWILKETEAIKGRVVTVGNSFIMPNNTDESKTGTPGTEIIMLAVGAAGTYDVTMEYKRTWEMFVNQTLHFTVVAE